MLILTIETSCDETSAAISQVKNNKIKLLSHVVSSQIKLHAKWGGVVPTLAAREHMKNLVPVLDLACKEAGFTNPDKLASKVDLIGVTQGPGLIPALLMGVSFAKALSYAFRKPLIPVNHIEGHIYTPWVKALPKKLSLSANPFPVLSLIVSGGHTMLVEVKDYLKYKVIGETLDDAAGEAFDKVARILNLGYPGGPQISKIAEIGASKYNFPEPLKNDPRLNFSFSGLKTAVLYKALSISHGKALKEILKKPPKPDLKIPLPVSEKRALAKAFQETAIRSLVNKTIKALDKKKYKTVILGGGVAANSLLRDRIILEVKAKYPKIITYLPPLELTGDNAAMLAPVAYFKWQKAKRANTTQKFFNNWKNLEAKANLRLGES